LTELYKACIEKWENAVKQLLLSICEKRNLLLYIIRLIDNKIRPTVAELIKQQQNIELEASSRETRKEREGGALAARALQSHLEQQVSAVR